MKRNGLNRSEFIKILASTAAAVAAPTIITLSALGAGETPAVSERVAVGHIGVGGRGGALLRGFLQLNNSRSVAVCDCFEKRREGAKKRIDDHYKSKGLGGAGCETYADFRELLARDDIDAVVIATPDHWHVPIAIYAVEAGKDVYVEKPLGVAMEWAWKLRDAIKRHGAVFQYGTQQRSSRNFRFACELVRNSYLGEIERVDAWAAGMRAPGAYERIWKSQHAKVETIPVPDGLDYDRWLGPAPLSPYTSPRCMSCGTYHIYDNALGFIAGWGAHPLDIAQWGLDTDNSAPVEYKGTGTIPTDGVFDTVAEWDVMCRYASGVEMRFMDTTVALPVVEKYRPFKDHGTTFFGDKGWVSVDRGGIFASDPKLLAVDLGPNEEHLIESKHHQGNFVDAVLSRRLPISPIHAAINSDLISHLSDISIRLGRPVKWDPKTEKIADDEQATRLLGRSMRAPWAI